MSFLVLQDDMPQQIWDAIDQSRLVFHPKYSPSGEWEYTTLSNLKKKKKEVIIVFDRNLLSSLLRLTKYGALKDLSEQKQIALLMLWAQMNNIPVSAGFAIMENAFKANDSVEARIELNNFSKIFEFYPTQIWLELAGGVIDRIPKMDFTSEQFKNDVEYHKEDDHFLMNLASMIKLVRLYREKKLTPIEKIIEFWNWNFDNLLISQYTNTYLILLMTNQEGVKAPKNTNSNDLDKVLNGCKNQAWDLTYLTDWSTFYYNEDNGRYNEIFLFATADILLRQIFINTHGGGDLFDLIAATCTRKEAEKLTKYYTKKMNNRTKPDFGDNPKRYFRSLVETELDYLRNELGV
ncbi:hypothetical protein ACHEVJ_16145 [Enterococcus raffinosus]|uniref:Uncharacterized protein n=2 Tax=Enterococcus raffinosus TaxID=71452 RepID=R2NVB0_9ENTE|nr:hypothetical protein [Enterococcus raffinosus]EOH74933.1 hypothetical protein UAK_03797 [Enterococcus raffinosus ATCC 49464]EOT82112.1 hypothetical protein I590_00537 [Enterococcus raffinosus ATCC 49464]MDK7989635.1 hypothetical protein [Enterococcus raffinosus]MDT2537126.1 hypothetical protein [Enterococcus raffinosus]OJG78082.1 hypothetical protein RV13_GL003613 [Enterococcus raffinosus]